MDYSRYRDSKFAGSRYAILCYAKKVNSFVISKLLPYVRLAIKNHVIE